MTTAEVVVGHGTDATARFYSVFVFEEEIKKILQKLIYTIPKSVECDGTNHILDILNFLLQKVRNAVARSAGIPTHPHWVFTFTPRNPFHTFQPP